MEEGRINEYHAEALERENTLLREEVKKLKVELQDVRIKNREYAVRLFHFVTALTYLKDVSRSPLRFHTSRAKVNKLAHWVITNHGYDSPDALLREGV